MEPKPTDKPFDAKKFIAGVSEATPIPGEEPTPTPEPPAPGQATPPEGTTPAAPVVQPELDPFWKTVQGAYNLTDLPPEIVSGKDEQGNEITPERNFQLLKETIIKQENPIDQIEDPFVQRYVKASQTEGFEKQKFFDEEMKFSNYDTMKSDEFLKVVYTDMSQQGGYEWTEDDIQKKVDSMSKMDRDLTAKQFKDEISMARREQYSAQMQSQEDQLAQVLPQHDTAQQEIVSNYLTSIKDSNTISGFDFGEADKTAFINEIGDFLKPQVMLIEGQPQIVTPASMLLMDILASPERSMELTPILWQIHKGKLKGYTSDVAERVKNNMIGKLGTEPSKQRGTAKPVGFDDKRFRGGK